MNVFPTDPQLGELYLVGRKGRQTLVLQLVDEVCPQHVRVLCLAIDEVVACPFRLIHLGQSVEQGLAGSVESWQARLDKVRLG